MNFKKLWLNIKEIALKISKTDVFSSVVRNLNWIILGGLALYFLNPNYALLHNLTLIIVLECLALGFSNLGVFVYTKIKFVNKLVDSDPTRLTAYEAQANSNIIAAIFIGAHILVGLSWFNLQYNETNIDEKMLKEKLVNTKYHVDTVDVDTVHVYQYKR